MIIHEPYCVNVCIYIYTFRIIYILETWTHHESLHIQLRVCYKHRGFWFAHEDLDEGEFISVKRIALAALPEQLRKLEEQGDGNTW